MIRVTVWNEYRHERQEETIAEVYPQGIHACIADFLSKNGDMTVTTATLDEPDCGLPDEVLNNTDVLIWWGHIAHHEVPDELAEKIRRRVNHGMGFIGLHSAHHSKPFRYLMGTSCNLRWRDDDRERLWNIKPAHPIMLGVPETVELAHEEMYGEIFDIPEPQELLMMGWFAGGEVMRSACTFVRSKGRIFYLQPGHEAYPTYKNRHIQTIITNAVRWVAPQVSVEEIPCIHAKTAPEA